MPILERAASGKRVTLWSLVGLILVPVLIAGGFVLATRGADTRFGEITAAIVNNDDGTEVNGKRVPMGRQLSAALVDLDTENYRWVQSTDEDAQEGLESGKYAAVVTIPEGFSREVLSTAKDDPMDVKQATIQVQTSDVSPVNNAVVSRALVDAARTKFNTDMSEKFLDNVFVGFNDMKDQMRTMGDAVGELDEGAGQLSNGTSELADGTGELSDGLGKLDANGGKLTSGATQLANGAGELSKGAGSLADGAGELSDGLGEMKTKTQDLPKQSKQLANGAKDLSDGVEKYTSGADKLAGGASELSKGVNEYTGNIDEVVLKVRDFTNELDKIDLDELRKLRGSDKANKLEDTETHLDRFKKGVEGLKREVKDYQKELRAQAKKIESSDVASLNQAVKLGMISQDQAKQIRGKICKKLPDGAKDPACDVVEGAYVSGLATGYVKGLKSAADALDKKDPSTGESIIDGCDSLDEAAKRINDRVAEITKVLEKYKNLDLDKVGKNLHELEKKLDKFKAGTDKLLDGSKKLRKGASDLSDGANELSDNGDKLVDGSKKLADGTDKLAKGTGPLVDGIGKAADGSKKLSDGAVKLSDGADKLSDGGHELSRGLRQYVFGVSQASDGAQKLNTGARQLADGADKLSDGTGKFAEGIEEGKEKIPSYTAPERDKLSAAVSSAIDGSSTKFVNAALAQAVALMLILALWVGSLITYTVVRAVSATALTSRRSSVAIMLRGLVPGLAVAAVQALLVTALAVPVMDIPLSNGVHLFAFALFASVVFTVLNFALVGLFGAVGQMVSLFMIVVAVAAHLFTTPPEVLTTLAGFTPPATGIEGAVAIVTGTPGAGGAWGTLFLWLLLGVGASIVAVARARSVKSAASIAHA